MITSKKCKLSCGPTTFQPCPNISSIFSDNCWLWVTKEKKGILARGDLLIKDLMWKYFDGYMLCCCPVSVFPIGHVTTFFNSWVSIYTIESPDSRLISLLLELLPTKGV